MRNIQMVDLISQHAKIRSELDAGIKEVIDNASFIKGPAVNEFEKELEKYLQVKKVIACANGTDALQAALMALDLPKGSEVIVPDFTFIATAEVIALLGLTPVFVDVDKSSFNLDPQKTREAITSNTKCIFPVHMFGKPCDMDAFMQIAADHNLYIIEDTAQALGAEYTFADGTTKKVGTIGDIGCTSFFPSKNLSCMGDGGAIFTNDENLGHKIAQICNHGMGQQYTYEEVGINSRLDSIQAAVLRVKLQHLDAYNSSRASSAAKYSELLGGIEALETPSIDSNGKHIFHQYTLKVLDNSRGELQKHLEVKGIPSKIYYPIPFHAHKPYKGYPHDEAKLTNALWLCDHVLSLPMHTELSDDDISFIANAVAEFYK